jgi:integrase
MRKPHYKKSHRAWYWMSDAKKLIRLGTTEQEAYAKWERLRKAEPKPAAPVPAPSAAKTPGGKLTVGQLIETYLEWVGRGDEDNRSKATHTSYTRSLRPLRATFPDMLAEEIRPKDLDAIVRDSLTTYKTQDGVSKRYSESTRWHFFKTVIAMYNWAQEKGHIETHSLVRLKDKPACAIRQEWITKEQFNKLIGACDDEGLRDLLIVLWDTGARPFEILQAEARHLDHDSRCLRYARSKGDKVKAKRKKRDATRKILLSGRAYEIVARLAVHYPEGPLFRNSIGNAWEPSLVSHRMKRLQKLTGVRATPYVLRHSFCTRLVLANVNTRKIQELMGHTDLKMIAEVYAHLDKADGDLTGVLDRLAG